MGRARGSSIAYQKGRLVSKGLRDYQRKAIARAEEEWLEHISTLVVLPTGAGKTRTAAAIMKKRGGRSMFVAHRRELLFQTQKTLLDDEGLDSELEMSEHRAMTSLFASPVVLGMVQTLNTVNSDGIRRLRRFRPEEFNTLVIDECHHGVCDSYKEVINHFRQNSELRVLCLTATPDRLDEESLGQIVDSLAFDYEILDAIRDGWLVEPYQQFVAVEGLDVSHIQTMDGDLSGPEVAEVMEMERNLQGVADATMKLYRGRRTLVFAASVKQAELLSNIFNRHKPGCSDWVCGKTPPDKRSQMLLDFAAGLLEILVNCNCLTEGFDNPGVEVLVNASPTKSRAKYAQRIGRALRPLRGVVDKHKAPEDRVAAIAASLKPFAHVLDFAGDSGKHKLVSVVDLLGGNISEEVKRKVEARAKQSGRLVQLTPELVAEEELLQKEQRAYRLAQEAKRTRLTASATFSLKTVSPFDLFDISPIAERGWSQKKISDKERMFFLKQHIDPDSMTAEQRRQLRGEMFRRWKLKLCSMGQAKVLKRFYPQLETRRLKHDAASQIIDKLKANNWRVL